MLNPTPYELAAGESLRMVVRPVETQPRWEGKPPLEITNVRGGFVDGFGVRHTAPFRPGDLLPNGKPIVRVGVKLMTDMRIDDLVRAGLCQVNPQHELNKYSINTNAWGAQFPGYPWGSNPWCWIGEA